MRTTIRLRRIPLWPLLLALVILGFAAGCSNNEDDNGYGGGGGGGNPGANEVWIQNTEFNPGDRTVSTGTTVTWTNKDAATHTVTGTGFNSGNMGNGATFSHTFDAPGNYAYHCTIHPSMTATITVTAQ